MSFWRMLKEYDWFFFFFQAEDGIRDTSVTGVQTCALPIYWTDPASLSGKTDEDLFKAIRNGKGEKMPAEAEGRAKDDEVWNMIAYIRNMSKGQPARPAEPAPVEAPAQPAPPAQ